jgi:hypothetical protein
MRNPDLPDTYPGDPAESVVRALFHEVSDELGTDDVAHAFGRHVDPLAAGQIVQDDEGAHPDITSEVIAHDVGFDSDEEPEDLPAEEAAMHYIDLEAGAEPYDKALDEPDGSRW